MGACRESLNVYIRLKYNKNKFKEIKRLFLPLINNKYHRKIFILDNFIIPYYKIIGCKIKPHVFRFNEDGYFCIKCHKWLTEKQHFEYNRILKIKKLKTKF